MQCCHGVSNTDVSMGTGRIPQVTENRAKREHKKVEDDGEYFLKD
jgi:hypothetical protein